ncbi:hypothetical protein L1987_11060 [Smallanthus sonchifolius]|uniref:Uncharacterized protein n=1 Tax=Smallanthus sonchifolius TaxID=185202 RepID=A0ACB9JC08_9ASTR|nr:hypothetical protein L1987_11060 [Smallanthus sonchifolius]
MASYQILSTLFFLYITLNYSTVVVGQECPYPCYPPPIGGGNGGNQGGGGNNQPTTTYSPPSQMGNYPPPSTIFPYNHPNPNYYGGGPPPPDPIVPWFPYYSQKPAHSTDQPSSTGSRMRSTVVIFLISFLLFSLLLLVH